jgi:5-fold beta-flower domain-containing protein
MKKSTILLLILMIVSFASVSFANELIVQDKLFTNVAIIDSDGKIYDARRWTLGSYNSKGIVYDYSHKHIGFVEVEDNVSEVRDIHYKVLARVDENGKIVDIDGNLIGMITGTKVTDKDGKILYRLSGEKVQKGLLIYLFFFTNAFGGN